MGRLHGKKLKTAKILFFALLVSCISQIDIHSLEYKEKRTGKSLKFIYQQLESGQSRKNIEKWLGIPDYSPTDGLVFYSSKNSEIKSSSLIVDYRNSDGIPTKFLQQFSFEIIGE